MSDIYDAALSPTGLSVNQYSLLVNINLLDTCSVSDLATYVGLERTTLVRTLKPLFTMGLIEDISAAEQRNRQIRVTPNGKAVLEQAHPLWLRAQLEVEQKIGREKVLTLSDILRLLLD